MFTNDREAICREVQWTGQGACMNDITAELKDDIAIDEFIHT